MRIGSIQVADEKPASYGKSTTRQRQQYFHCMRQKRQIWSPNPKHLCVLVKRMIEDLVSGSPNIDAQHAQHSGRHSPHKQCSVFGRRYHRSHPFRSVATSACQRNNKLGASQVWLVHTAPELLRCVAIAHIANSIIAWAQYVSISIIHFRSNHIYSRVPMTTII